VIVKEGVNKSNHPIQNPLLLVTESQTRDNIENLWRNAHRDETGADLRMAQKELKEIGRE
jgi:hypothetical protein